MSVLIHDFGKTADGNPVKVAVLKNDFIEVHILNYGAIIHRIVVPDRSGSPVDVALGYDSATDYELNGDSMPSAALPTASAGRSSPCTKRSCMSPPTRTATACTAACMGSAAACLQWIPPPIPPTA